MSEKRMKKNISFSEHDKDIYDYLNKQKNASALIKRLVYNHMLLEQGLVAVEMVDVPKVTQGTPMVEKSQEPPIEPIVEPPVVEPILNEQDAENMALIDELDI